MYSVNGKEFNDWADMTKYCISLREQKTPYVVKYFGMKLDEYNKTGFAIEVNCPKKVTIEHRNVPEGVWFLTEEGFTKSFDEAEKHLCLSDANCYMEELENFSARQNKVYLRVVTEYK